MGFLSNFNFIYIGDIMFGIALILAILIVYLLDSFTDALVAIVLISWYYLLKVGGYDVSLPTNFWSSKK